MSSIFSYIMWMAGCLCVVYLGKRFHQDALREEEKPAEAVLCSGNCSDWNTLGPGIHVDFTLLWVSNLILQHLILPSCIITDIINTSLISSLVPSSFKTTTVTQILKKPGVDPNNLINYRPNSNWPFVSKTPEKTFAAQVHSHLTWRFSVWVLSFSQRKMTGGRQLMWGCKQYLIWAQLLTHNILLNRWVATFITVLLLPHLNHISEITLILFN